MKKRFFIFYEIFYFRRCATRYDLNHRLESGSVEKQIWQKPNRNLKSNVTAQTCKKL
jgi:hypothetical protein